MTPAPAPLAALSNDARWADLDRLRAASPMYDATIEEVKGRRIRVGAQWLCTQR